MAVISNRSLSGVEYSEDLSLSHSFRQEGVFSLYVIKSRIIAQRFLSSLSLSFLLFTWQRNVIKKGERAFLRFDHCLQLLMESLDLLSIINSESGRRRRYWENTKGTRIQKWGGKLHRKTGNSWGKKSIMQSEKIWKEEKCNGAETMVFSNQLKFLTMNAFLS